MRAKPSVLLVEDEENVAYLVALALRHSGFEVRVIGTGSEALSISSSKPDVGHRGARRDAPRHRWLRSLSQNACRPHGLTIGGDDYLTKPSGVDERVARVKVILRQVGRSPSIQLIFHGDLSLDDDAHTVKRRDTEVVLSPLPAPLGPISPVGES